MAIEDNDTKEEMVDGVPKSLSDVMDKVNEELEEQTELEEQAKLDALEDDDKNTGDETGDDDLIDDEIDDEADDEDGLEVYGWDEDTLAAVRALDPEVLEELKGKIEESDVDDSSADDSLDLDDTLVEAISDPVGLTEEQINVLKEKNPEMAEVIIALNTQVGQLTTSLNSVAEAESTRAVRVEQQEQVKNFKSANDKMDTLVKDFPLLNTYDKLPTSDDGTPDPRNRSVKERIKIWERATALNDAGITSSFDDAMDEAITWYQGKNAENRVQREVVADLNKRKRKMTARPTQQKTKKKQYAPGSEAHKKSVMDKAFKAAGIT